MYNLRICHGMHILYDVYIYIYYMTYIIFRYYIYRYYIYIHITSVDGTILQL